MLDDIFGEIASLFPSPYIHVGGDEVNVNAWKASPEHRAYMEKHGMKNPHQLQNMFMIRLEKILKNHGKTLMGWNEIMHGGKLSKDTGVMAWISIGAGINAAKQGYPTVMAVGPHNYFDMKYPGHGETGHWWAGVIDTKRAYEWNPLFTDKLDSKQQKNILGVHCALWTEFVPTPENADYKLWPRACATAEVGWTQQEKRNWDGFSNRLGRHLDFLDALKIKYRVKPPQAVISQGVITIVPPYNDVPSKILYTLDGSDPKPGKAVIYQGKSLDASDAGQLRYLTERPNGRMSKIMKGVIQEPIGKWNNHSFGKEDFLTFDISKVLTASGNWIAEIKYQKGKEPLEIESVSIIENAQTIATAQGGVLDGKHKMLRVRLPLSKIHKDTPYLFTVKLKKGSGKNSHGTILFDRSVWIEPVTTVKTQVPHYGTHTADKAANWTRSDWFWSNRPGKKGDQWTLHFDQAVQVTTINLPTGKPNSNDDIIVDATIEVSQDGKTFKKSGSFAYGTGKVKFTKPTAIKALRITLNTDHQTWIILRDPEMK
jgi:hexosaminidase